MKKLLGVLSIVMMFGCCGSKVPTQYVGTGIIMLPDYTYLVTAPEYCCVDTLVQIPEPGLMCTTAPSFPITIIGYDCYGNVRKFEFSVVTVKNF